MTGNIVLEPDEQPARWVDTCDVLGERTADEQALGNALGASIDTGDDGDAGVESFGAGDGSEFERAMTKARALKVVMLAHGVPEVSIELQPGRPSPHGQWDALFLVTEMSHHTVSERSDGLTPVLALCKRGRSDLPGPLANGYGGWDLCYRILTFGYANHPGAGGPLRVPALSGGTFTIPRDSARRYAWGTEWEGGIRSSEWDHTLRNPRNGMRMTMREFMGRSNAALRAYHRIAHHGEHSTWTTRKIDRLGYTAATGTAELKRYEMEDDMPLTDDDVARIAKATIDGLIGKELNPPGPEDDLKVGAVLGQTWARLERIERTVDETRAAVDALAERDPS